MGFPWLNERVAEIRGEIAGAIRRGGHGQEVRLIAVTKTHGPEAVLAAAAAGIHDVGENKVQEALSKQEALRAAGTMPAGLTWHLIGHLQTNKVKALPQFRLFHALDRAKLADEAAAMAAKLGVTLDVLVQVNVAGEDTKGGYVPAALASEAERLRGLPNLRVRGVMTMAPFDAPESVLRAVFRGAREARDVLRAAGHPADELSMGMSGDYLIAVEEGATLVRLGTILFGTRH
ncbi:MAG: YggS family pyridoxal phosphate-dependent enzyme [Gemmatimonadaceae bacterium]|nr:YggS family pyridoxal phosphate-dependent enzyme [Gemmatimonadaceae bacterium]MCW5824918.1 YggS family pyridoxal phosphate-dependent enzyme [Gemmatimonadaceae bacterium]